MLRALAGCLALHIARSDDVTQRKLYSSSSPLFFVPQLNFMPAVGLYFVARQPQAGQEMFRVYKLPATAPHDAVRGAHLGDVHRRGAEPRDAGAHRARESLRNATRATPSWTITAHAAKSGTWYELDPGDPTVIPALLVCGHVAATIARRTVADADTTARPCPNSTTRRVWDLPHTSGAAGDALAVTRSGHPSTGSG